MVLNVHHLDIEFMDKKKVLEIVLKIVIGVAMVVASAFGISTLTSCSAYKNMNSVGKTTIVTVDTTNVDHNAGFSLSIKRK